MNLFVYGTLLFPSIRELVGGRNFSAQPAVLQCFNIFTVKGADFPGIIKSSDNSSRVEGELLSDLSEIEFMRFDTYEDSFYERISVDVETESGSEKAEVYIVPTDRAGFLTDTKWTREWFAENHYEDFLRRLSGY